MLDREVEDSPERFLEKFPPKVVILDAGAQYVDMIKKACERHGYPAAVLPIETRLDMLPESTEAIIVSGGPGNSYTDAAIMPDTRIWDQDDIPTLNICYGLQSLALYAGGKVGPA